MYQSHLGDLSHLLMKIFYFDWIENVIIFPNDLIEFFVNQRYPYKYKANVITVLQALKSNSKIHSFINIFIGIRTRPSLLCKLPKKQ